MKRLVHIFMTTLLTGVFIMTSCTYEKDLIFYPDESEEGMSEVSFLVDLPQATQITTRGEVGSTAENKINDIYVLVFNKNNGDLISKSKGKSLSVVQGSENNNKVTFKATLPVGTEYTFMVLANAENKLTGINVGSNPAANKTDVLALTVEMQEDEKWETSSPIPMWAEQNLTLTASSSPSFQLTRMLARVNVEVNLKEISAGVTKENFQLTSIRYYNYNTAGALAADVDSHAARLPTLPGDPKTKTGSALLYDGSDITNNESCREKIYIFEVAHNGKTYNTPTGNSDWIDNPCLVIGGKYKTEEGEWMDETFYRVDFIRKDNTDPNNIKDIWLSILRNYSYNVVITEVSGSGFPDPDIAVKSAPINMEANVLEWDESDMGEIIFDGVFYLSVSQDEFIFERGEVNDEREEYTLYVKTDYIFNNNKEDAKSGWHVEKYVDGEDGETPVTWLKLNPEKGKPDDRITAYFTFEENPLNVNRKAIVWIAAGRLRYPVYITQRVLSLYIVDPDNNNQPVSEMRFEVPRSGSRDHEPRKFEVQWTPVNRSVSITHESPRSWNPFAPEWLNPDPSAIGWTIPAGGTQIFDVETPTVSDSELALDPFYERETTYSFTVENGSDSETKSITLHQIYYNIIVDTYGYRLDGKTYTLSVRSNTNWEITDIEEWLYNQDPTQNPSPAPPVLLQLNNYDNLKVGTKGGPNTAGESVAFTVVNQETEAHRNKWGTVYVTFKNPEGKFEPVRVPLSFPPRKLTVLGLGYTLDVRAYNPAQPSPYHNNSLYDILINENNFGSKEESLIKVDRLEIYSQNAQDASTNPNGTATDEYSWRRGDLQKWLNNYQPDIIFISYSMYLNSDESKLIKQYLENGGVVIMYYGGDVQAQNYIKPFFDELFDESFTTSTTSTTTGILRRTDLPNTGSVFQLEDIDDPILNGPFGDVRGKLWGTHYSRVGIREDLIGDKVHILGRTNTEQNSRRAGGATQGYINMFRHKEYNLFWVGNGMGTATYYQYYNPVEYYHDPNFVDIDGNPGVRTGFGGYADPNNKFDVYNAYFFANAMAWAISVTNHTPPVGGY